MISHASSDEDQSGLQHQSERPETQQYSHAQRCKTYHRNAS